MALWQWWLDPSMGHVVTVRVRVSVEGSWVRALAL
jgi:hypothetical protein